MANSLYYSPQMTICENFPDNHQIF